MKLDKSTIAALFVTVVLIPTAVVLQYADPLSWPKPLFGVDTDTPIKNIQAAPIEIKEDITWSGIVALKSSVEIAPDTVVTIAPGTVIIASENISVWVHGTLIAQGTATNPIQITSFDAENTYWHGIQFSPASQGTLEHLEIRRAAVGVTCANKSAVTITNSTIREGILGIAAAPNTCRTTNTELRGLKATERQEI